MFLASFVHNVKAWKRFLQCFADKAVCQDSVLGALSFFCYMPKGK
jgi:hypothetical protein